MHIDLNRLRIFYHIHSSLSITAAADKLYITPSAVSQQLKKLESEIKCPLFTRLHKRLIPTSAGNRLYQLAAPLLRELESGVRVMIQELSEPTGLLRIGAPMEFGSLYLPHAVATFRTTYPNVTFAIELGRPQDLLTKVSSGDLDFAFVDTFPTKKKDYSEFGTFRFDPVIEEQVVLACSDRYFHSQLNGKSTFEALQEGFFISQQRDARAINNWFLHHFGKEPGQLDIVLTVANHQAVVSGIRQHLGLGIIVSHLLWDEIESGGIKVIHETKRQTVNRISLVQLDNKHPTLTEEVFQLHVLNLTQRSTTLQRLKLTQV